MKIIVPATSEPITLAMARKQCRVDPDPDTGTHEDDDLIELFVSAAREWCENYLGMIVAPTLVEIAFDAFPTAEITLESGPVIAVDAIYYVDEDGADQVVDASIYRLDTTAVIAYVRLNDGEVWPATDDTTDAVRVDYTIGYTAPDESPASALMPKSIQAAILLLLGHLYANRSNTTVQALTTIPFGVTHFLDPYRQRLGFA